MIKKPKKDVRIVKTLKSIDTAFIQLLNDKGYDDIIIQDILDIALINRTTFYKYYNNKAELAYDLVERFKAEFFMPMISQRFSTSWEDFSKNIVPLYEQNHATLKTLWQIKLPKANLENDFYCMAKNHYTSHVQKARPQTSKRDLEYQAHIYASFAVAMVTHSVGRDDYLHPNEVIENLKTVFTVMTT